MKLGILSDVHEDASSLLKAIRLLEKKGCSQLICLGDTVGYSIPFFDFPDSRDGSLCLEIVQDTCMLVLSGNHDLHAAEKTPVSNPGFDFPANWYELPLEKRAELCGDRVWLYEPNEAPNNLSLAQMELIWKFPEFQILEFDGKKYFFSHYLYPDLTGSGTLLPPNRERFTCHQEHLAGFNSDYSFFGHVHPEGLLYFRENQIKTKGFGSRIELLPGTLVGVPCVANGRNQPGVCMVDTVEKWVLSIPLRTWLKRLIA